MSFNDDLITEFRENKGVVGGMFEGAKLLLLISKGAKSGVERITPLVYSMDGDKYVIAASKGGADTHPDWYYNLIANPDVQIEVGENKFDVVATEVDEPTRRKLYDSHAEENPGFKEYESKTKRLIPIFTLKIKN